MSEAQEPDELTEAALQAHGLEKLEIDPQTYAAIAGVMAEHPEMQYAPRQAQLDFLREKAIVGAGSS